MVSLDQMNARSYKKNMFWNFSTGSELAQDVPFEISHEVAYDATHEAAHNFDQ